MPTTGTTASLETTPPATRALQALVRRVSALSALALIAACSTSPVVSFNVPLQYPEAAPVHHVDIYHGIEIEDPYRWLEEPDAPQTRSWIEAQNELTFDYLGAIPARAPIEERLTQLWDFEKFGNPKKEGGRYFYTRNDGLQPQSVLYVTDALDADPRILLDPNTLSADGTIALDDWHVSPDGKLLAYAVAASGSDWVQWRVRDVSSAQDRDDLVRWSKFSGASWLPDSSGFFYSRYDEPEEGAAYKDVNYNQKLYLHRLGRPQADDVLVYERPEHKEWGFGGRVTDDGRYLMVSVWRGTEQNNAVFYRDLETHPFAATGSGSSSGAASGMVELLRDWDAGYDFVDNEGPILWFRTNLDAPRGRLIAIDATRPDRSDWREVIPHSRDTLESAHYIGGRFITQYLSDATAAVKVFDRRGALLRDVELPGIGSVDGFGGHGNDPETFFGFSGFTTPRTVYRYDVTTGERTVFRRPDVDVDEDAYETRQVFVESKDGTRIPMFLVHKKGIVLDGTNPTYLYGYGGFNISLTPFYSVVNQVWMDMGGVYAVPNLRGGGEYGEDWHEAGTKLLKQNVFDDFIAAAEWLVAEGYTTPQRLAIAGGSNGGLLVGACMTQRPELYGACLPAVGVMDMLRYHKFTIGWAWVSDYGSVDDPDEFQALLAYSPLHNLTQGTCYPPTLVTTGDHDDRVVPAHSFKFAAALQAAQGCANPTLIRVETKAGHGAGKPTAKIIAERADVLAFLVQVFGMQVQD